MFNLSGIETPTVDFGIYSDAARCPRQVLPAQVSRTRGNLSNDRHSRGAGQRATCTLSFKKQLGSSGRRMLHSWQLSSRGGELEIMTSPQFDAHGFDRKGRDLFADQSPVAQLTIQPSCGSWDC